MTLKVKLSNQNIISEEGAGEGVSEALLAEFFSSLLGDECAALLTHYQPQPSEGGRWFCIFLTPHDCPPAVFFLLAPEGVQKCFLVSSSLFSWFCHSYGAQISEGTPDDELTTREVFVAPLYANSSLGASRYRIAAAAFAPPGQSPYLRERLAQRLLEERL